MRKYLAGIMTALTLVPSAVFAAPFAAQSIRLVNASTQFATGPNWDVTGNQTIEAWVKFPSSLTSAGVLLGKSSPTISSGDDIDFEFNINSEGGAEVNTTYSVTTNNGAYVVQEINVSGNTLYNGSWHHVAMVYTAAGGSAEIFMDGASQGTITSLNTSVRAGATKLWYVGKRGGAVRFTPEAQISLLRQWSTTRTGAQLLANQCTILGSTTNLQLEMTFDNVYTDNSGNSRTFTGSGTPTFPSDTPACAAAAVSVQVRNLMLFGWGF